MSFDGAVNSYLFLSVLMAPKGKYVITGGPGSGKSTLIDLLQQGGYHCSAEVSRQMIIREVELGTDCLPWLDVSCFSVKVLSEMISEWNSITGTQPSFFDRGIPDVIAYLKLADLDIDNSYYEQAEAHPYAHKVFILPPWQDIYINDPERWQSYNESVAIYKMIRETYTSLGYQLVEVPLMPVTQRMEFVLHHLK
jgi:predicted ATPase